ncbi:MAG: Gluconeogenesis factor [Firmicutes bacterium]|nr:Gluconeogenesis factor [candidate division NPL-UPA2 bacterium]
MRLLKWLYPGLRVKRYLFLATCGVGLSMVGLGLLWGRKLLGFLEEQLYIYLKASAGTTALYVTGALLLGLGLVVVGVAVKSVMRSILEIITPEQETELVDVLFRRRLLKSGPRVVAIGGGSGLSVLLRGIKHYTSNITAVVTVSDDGGSSGRLRGEMGILPPGDIRNCVLALADTEPLLESLFQYRFKDGELLGHSFGNLLIAAMTGVTGDFQLAIKEFSKVLAVRGRVLPVTAADVRLRAELEDGSVVEGETNVSLCGGQVRTLELVPSDAEALPEVLRAIAEADAILLGPGSLYTSVIPNLLVRGVGEALAATKAPKIYICNVMTQPGETEGFTASRHVSAIERFSSPRLIDCIVVNSARVRAHLLSKYAAASSGPVTLDFPRLHQLGVRIATGDLLHQGDVVRHDPDKLARRVMQLISSTKKLN